MNKKKMWPFLATVVFPVVSVAYLTALEPQSIRIIFLGAVIELDFEN